MNNKWIKFILVLLIMIYLYRENMVYTPILNMFSNQNVKGQIISEKYYQRNGQFTDQFTYYYKFSVNDKDYSNPSDNKEYNIGDTVTIEYNKTFPFMNRIKNKKPDYQNSNN